MPVPKNALSLAFLENAKPLAQSASRIHAAQGIRTESTVFQQAVVDRFTLRALAVSQDVRLRPATAADSVTLHALLGSMTVSGFSWRPSLEAMTHHYHAAPDARVWLAERDRQPVGFLAGYTLEWLRRGAVSRMFIVETLVASDDPVAVSLLVEAGNHAASEKLRGVVIENPTYLGFEDPAACGVILTPRRMLAVARAVDQAEGLVGSFFCDIK